MTTEQMHDLSFELLADGSINLEQVAGSLDGPAYINLHPCQLRHVAERAGLLKSAPAWPRGFERRLLRVRKEAAKLADFLGSIMNSSPQQGMTDDEAMAHALWESITDLMADYGLDADDSSSSTSAPTDDIAEVVSDAPAGQPGLF